MGDMDKKSFPDRPVLKMKFKNKNGHSGRARRERWLITEMSMEEKRKLSGLKTGSGTSWNSNWRDQN
jgi:hypothetical protein